MRNVAHRKQRLPVLPLLQRDVSFAAHELVQHRAHLCRHLFLLHAQKKGRGGAFLLVIRGESKALREGTFSDDDGKNSPKFSSSFHFLFLVFQSTSFEGVQISPFRDRRYNTSKRPLCLYLYLSLYLSIYLSLPPSLSFPSSRAIGSVCVSSEGAWNSREQRRSALADDGVDAAFPSSLRIVYRPLLFGEKFGFDAVDSRFSNEVV